VAKPGWGTKRTCQSCDAKFYDLGKAPIVCPKCGAIFDPEAVLKTRRGRPAEKVVPLKPEAKKAAVVPELEADEVEPIEAEEGDEEEELIEDASELGEDDEDMAEVIEKVDGEEEP
jgi:uncharacterized protein (TIGR02300 family)